MKRLFLIAVLLLSIVTVNDAWATDIDCPAGFASETIEIRGDNNLLLGYMFVCYICSDIAVGEVYASAYFNAGWVPTDEFLAKAHQKLNDPQLIYDLCDIPPCKDNEYVYYTLYTSVCIQKRKEDGQVWILPCVDCDPVFCYRHMQMCYDSNTNTFVQTVVEEGIDGTPDCSSTTEPDPPINNGERSTCWLSPDAWCIP